MCNCDITRKLPVGPAGQDGADGADGTNGTNGVDGRGYNATSTTGLTIGTGSKSLTINTLKAYSAGARVRISDSTIDPTLNWMEGVVTAYNSGTGAMTVIVDLIGGSGTLSAWNVNVAGETGEDGATIASTENYFSTYNNFKDFNVIQSITAIPITAGGILDLTSAHGNIFTVTNPSNVTTIERVIRNPSGANPAVGFQATFTIQSTSVPIVLTNNSTNSEGIQGAGPVGTLLEVGSTFIATQISNNTGSSIRWRVTGLMPGAVNIGEWQDPGVLGIYGNDQFSNPFEAAGTSPLKFRMEGKTVRITGVVWNSILSNLCDTTCTLMTLPSDYRPQDDLIIQAVHQNTGVVIPIYITAAGVVTILYTYTCGGGAYNVTTLPNRYIYINATIPLD